MRPAISFPTVVTHTAAFDETIKLFEWALCCPAIAGAFILEAQISLRTRLLLAPTQPFLLRLRSNLSNLAANMG
jgi:hypothetical protein